MTFDIIIIIIIITHADGSCVGMAFTGFCMFVCLSVFFHTISQKPMQLGSPNMT